VPVGSKVFKGIEGSIVSEGSKVSKGVKRFEVLKVPVGPKGFKVFKGGRVDCLREVEAAGSGCEVVSIGDEIARRQALEFAAVVRLSSRG
jgi:hypothetical protein